MIKLRRSLSGLLLGLGCAAAFIGLLALILPSVANDQLRLVLSSFSMPSSHPIVGFINSCMSYALRNSWQVFLFGALAAVLGGVLVWVFAPKPQPAASYEACRRPAGKSAVPFKPGPDPSADLMLWDRSSMPEAKASAEPQPFSCHKEENPFSFFTPTPILEPNRIADIPEPLSYTRPADADIPSAVMPAPRTSDRFQLESRAIVSEAGTPSQSGGRVIIRSSFAVPDKPEPEPMPEMQLPEDPYAGDPRFEPNEEVAPEEPAPVSSRIRSTMGKHTGL